MNSDKEILVTKERNNRYKDLWFGAFNMAKVQAVPVVQSGNGKCAETAPAAADGDAVGQKPLVFNF